jgi:1-pyrroline-5-carboxylate dehydrogenase
MNVADAQKGDIGAFVESLNQCSKSGLHNPMKNPERYLKYGAVSAKIAHRLKEPENMEYFTKLIQRVAPKSYGQAYAEVKVTQTFIENFGGDQVRFLARSFAIPGDHTGQMSNGYRWPYGPVTIIAPFNFPFEIPVLQLFGALYMGNKVLIKSDSKVSVVMEQAIRFFLDCGMPETDVDFINCDGPTMHNLLMEAQPRMTQFTGSSKVAEILARDLHGKIKIEDAGWDWKILGPDVSELDFVAFTCDQDAYAYSGQKCSAQSALFVHENWEKAGLMEKLKTLAARRKLDDLTVGPVLTVTNETFQNHVSSLLKIPGAKLEFGGDLLEGHSIPSCYGTSLEAEIMTMCTSACNLLSVCECPVSVCNSINHLSGPIRLRLIVVVDPRKPRHIHSQIAERRGASCLSSHRRARRSALCS